MDIHWARFPDLPEGTRTHIEARLQRLAAGHGDLQDIHIVAERSAHQPQGGHQVKITCLAHGHPITAVRERSDFGHALHQVIDDFEQEVHKLRERQRDTRTRAAEEIPES